LVGALAFADAAGAYGSVIVGNLPYAFEIAPPLIIRLQEFHNADAIAVLMRVASFLIRRAANRLQSSTRAQKGPRLGPGTLVGRPHCERKRAPE